MVISHLIWNDQIDLAFAKFRRPRVSNTHGTHRGVPASAFLHVLYFAAVFGPSFRLSNISIIKRLCKNDLIGRSLVSSLIDNLEPGLFWTTAKSMLIEFLVTHFITAIPNSHYHRTDSRIVLFP